MTDDRKATIDEFQTAVNMTPKELESWLETEDSKAVGQKDDGEESTGHKSGRHIVKLLQMKRADCTEDDLAQMKRVISYVHRHSASNRLMMSQIHVGATH